MTNDPLLSAAPDLLAALEAFIKTEHCLGWKEGEGDLWLGPILEQAKDAIAKAKGGV